LRQSRRENGLVDPEKDDVVTTQDHVPDGFLVLDGYYRDGYSIDFVSGGLSLGCNIILVIDGFYFLFGDLEIFIFHVFEIHVQVLIEAREHANVALVLLDLDGDSAV
jgi:hypothetical protein